MTMKLRSGPVASAGSHRHGDLGVTLPVGFWFPRASDGVTSPRQRFWEKGASSRELGRTTSRPSGCRSAEPRPNWRTSIPLGLEPQQSCARSSGSRRSRGLVGAPRAAIHSAHLVALLLQCGSRRQSGSAPTPGSRRPATLKVWLEDFGGPS